MSASIISWGGKPASPISSLSGHIRTASDEFAVATILTDSRHANPERAALEMLGELTIHESIEGAQIYADERLRKLVAAAGWRPPSPDGGT